VKREKLLPLGTPRLIDWPNTVKYPFFAQILVLYRARGFTIPTIRLGRLHSITPKPIVGIVVPQARHSAKIRAKSLIV
jgi:hypothetical protein